MIQSKLIFSHEASTKQTDKTGLRFAFGKCKKTGCQFFRCILKTGKAVR